MKAGVVFVDIDIVTRSCTLHYVMVSGKYHHKYIIPHLTSQRHLRVSIGRTAKPPNSPQWFNLKMHHIYHLSLETLLSKAWTLWTKVKPRQDQRVCCVCPMIDFNIFQRHFSTTLPGDGWHPLCGIRKMVFQVTMPSTSMVSSPGSAPHAPTLPRGSAAQGLPKGSYESTSGFGLP